MNAGATRQGELGADTGWTGGACNANVGPLGNRLGTSGGGGPCRGYAHFAEVRAVSLFFNFRTIEG